MSIFNTLVDNIEEQEIPVLDGNFFLQLEEAGISLYDLNRIEDVDSVTEAFFEDPEAIKNFKANSANIKDLKNQWKKACNSFVESKPISRYINDKQQEMVQKYYDIVCNQESTYGEYKKAFNFFCKFMGLPNKGVVIESITFKKDKKDKDQKVLELKYSKGLVKVNIPEGVNLIHMSPVKDIKALEPAFRSRKAGKYLYPTKRCYFTVAGNINPKKAGLSNQTTYRYTPATRINYAYIDPAATRYKDGGAVYVETDKPIPVVNFVKKMFEIFRKHETPVAESFLEEKADIDEYLTETIFKNVDDIKYNKEKFDSGEINLCFITGFSGSGKSTLGAYLQKEKNIEHYDMDKVMYQYNVPDESLKEQGNMFEAFFKGPGKKYREMIPEIKKNQKDSKYWDKYTCELTKDFVKYAMQYANSHKNTKFVCEGVWLYRFIDPALLKNYAVFIKGTSATTSSYRAIKRDYALDKEAKGKGKATKNAIAKSGRDLRKMAQAEKGLSKYINMYKDK